MGASQFAAVVSTVFTIPFFLDNIKNVQSVFHLHFNADGVVIFHVQRVAYHPEFWQFSLTRFHVARSRHPVTLADNIGFLFYNLSAK